MAPHGFAIRRSLAPQPSGEGAGDAEITHGRGSVGHQTSLAGVGAASKARARPLRPDQTGRFIRTSRTVWVAEFMTMVWVWTEPASYCTPSSRAPLVTPVAAKMAS